MRSCKYWRPPEIYGVRRFCVRRRHDDDRQEEDQKQQATQAYPLDLWASIFMVKSERRPERKKKEKKEKREEIL